jgi:hypothetical protein
MSLDCHSEVSEFNFLYSQIKIFTCTKYKFLKTPIIHDRCPRVVHSSCYPASPSTVYHFYDQQPADMPHGYSYPRNGIYTLSQVVREQIAHTNLIWRQCIDSSTCTLHQWVHSPYNRDKSVVGIAGALVCIDGGGVNDDASEGGGSVLPPALSKLAPVHGPSLPLPSWRLVSVFSVTSVWLSCDRITPAATPQVYVSTDVKHIALL